MHVLRVQGTGTRQGSRVSHGSATPGYADTTNRRSGRSFAHRCVWRRHADSAEHATVVGASRHSVARWVRPRNARQITGRTAVYRVALIGTIDHGTGRLIECTVGGHPRRRASPGKTQAVVCNTGQSRVALRSYPSVARCMRPVDGVTRADGDTPCVHRPRPARRATAPTSVSRITWAARSCGVPAGRVGTCGSRLDALDHR
jgi:hypothetical protein